VGDEPAAGFVHVIGTGGAGISALPGSADGGGGLGVNNKDGALPGLVPASAGGGPVQGGEESNPGSSVAIAASEEGLGVRLRDNDQLKLELGEDRDAGFMRVLKGDGKVLAALQVGASGGGEADVYDADSKLVAGLAVNDGAGLLSVTRA